MFTRRNSSSTAVKTSDTRASIPPTSFRAAPRYSPLAPAANDVPDAIYWSHQLAAVPPAIRLDFERDMLPLNAADAPTEFELIVLTEQESQRIRALARAELTTVHSVLLAAWCTLVMRRSHRSEFVVGCASSNTKNTVPDRPILVHASVVPQEKFRDLVRRTAARRTEGVTHSHASLDEVIEALGRRDDRDHHPIFQTVFVERQPMTDAPSAAILPDGRRKPCALACVWSDNGKSIRLRIEFPGGSLSDADAALLRAHFVRILRASALAPDTPVGALPMRFPAERGESQF